MDYYYGKKNYKILEKKYEIKDLDDGEYLHKYSLSVEYNGMEFEAYETIKSPKKLFGIYSEDDYPGFRDNYLIKVLDTQGNSCLQKYKNDVDRVLEEGVPEYEFYYDGSNLEEISECITTILRCGMKNDKLNICFEVYDMNGNSLCWDNALVQDIVDDDIKEDEYTDYIKRYIQREEDDYDK